MVNGEVDGVRKMAILSEASSAVGWVLDRVLRRTDYGLIWNWQARSASNARLAVAGTADLTEHRHSGAVTAETISAFTGIDRNSTVLEIGCGTGRVGAALAPRCRTWIGGDVSSRMVAHAKRALAEHDNVKFITLSGYSLEGIESESIDVVYCTGVFMHLEEWERFTYIRDGFRVLRPGGRIYVDNINLLGEQGWRQFLEVVEMPLRKRPPQVSKTSTAQELSTFLERAGFIDVQVTPDTLWVSAVGKKK